MQSLSNLNSENISEKLHLQLREKWMPEEMLDIAVGIWVAVHDTCEDKLLFVFSVMKN